MKTLHLAVAALLMVGCGDGDPKDDDLDGDGFASVAAGGEDCDDDDASIHPAADELCDEVDSDCDGEVDEAAVDGQLFYLDGDADGFGSDEAPLYACQQPSGAVIEAGDCDDGDAATWPGASELCDEADNDCNGLVDDDATDAPTWYRDADMDGHGDPDKTKVACTAPQGWVDSSDDCDDYDAGRSPDEPEVCDDWVDNDCDGLISCEDGDCSGSESCAEDCGDGADNDADGLTDCEDDECWGTEDCPPQVRARVTDGAVFVFTSSTWSRKVSPSTSTDYRRAVASAYGTGIQGQVQVLANPTLNWSTATSWASCRWSVSSASARHTSSSLLLGGSVVTWSYTAPPVRDGFYVAAGCGLSTSGFLPRTLLPRGSQVLAGKGGEVLWYTGTPASAYTTSFYDSSPGYSTTFSFGGRTSSFLLDPVSTGSWYATP